MLGVLRKKLVEWVGLGAIVVTALLSLLLRREREKTRKLEFDLSKEKLHSNIKEIKSDADRQEADMRDAVAKYNELKSK